jgi:hypothetical protein
MNTDDLADMLATGSSVGKPGSIAARYALAIVVGALLAIALMSMALGVRTDLGDAISQPAFWLKIAYLLALAGVGTFASARLSRPGARLRWAWLAIIAPVLVVWTVALVELATAAPQDRSALFFGATWRLCPLLIAMLAVPPFAAMMWAMAGMAPTELRLAGGITGFAAGAVAAVVYSAHCPEITAPFIGFWYLLGIAVPTTAGALLGPRLLRW